MPPLNPLCDVLAAVTDARTACWAVVDHLAMLGGVLPSVYLERGGRLRCQAVRGYYEIIDGLPPSAGIIGRTFSTGEPTIALDVTLDPLYTQLVPGVASQVCCPIGRRGGPIGVVNVEATRELTLDDVEAIKEAATALATRLRELGGPPNESPAQRLIRHVSRLSALTRVDDMEREILDAALDVSGMGSAMLLRIDGSGNVTARRATGPLALELEALPGRILRELAGSVEGGASRYTLAPQDRDRPVVKLPGTKIKALLALPVASDDSGSDVLLLADRRAKGVTTDEIELLEMLCTQAGSSLRVAGLLRELRTQAATDPLTGLGHHRSFHTKLRRLRSRDIAVLLIDLDGFKLVNDGQGHQAGDRILREMAATLSSALRRGDELFRVGGDEFAALVRVAHADEALDAADRLVQAARNGGVTVSIGVAMCEDQEPLEEVVARADRALYDVKQAGRNAAALAA